MITCLFYVLCCCVLQRSSANSRQNQGSGPKSDSNSKRHRNRIANPTPTPNLTPTPTPTLTPDTESKTKVVRLQALPAHHNYCSSCVFSTDECPCHIHLGNKMTEHEKFLIWLAYLCPYGLGCYFGSLCFNNYDEKSTFDDFVKARKLYYEHRKHILQKESSTKSPAITSSTKPSVPISSVSLKTEKRNLHQARKPSNEVSKLKLDICEFIDIPNSSPPAPSVPSDPPAPLTSQEQPEFPPLIHSAPVTSPSWLSDYPIDVVTKTSGALAMPAITAPASTRKSHNSTSSPLPSTSESPDACVGPLLRDLRLDAPSKVSGAWTKPFTLRKRVVPSRPTSSPPIPLPSPPALPLDSSSVSPSVSPVPLPSPPALLSLSSSTDPALLSPVSFDPFVLLWFHSDKQLFAPVKFAIKTKPQSEKNYDGRKLIKLPEQVPDYPPFEDAFGIMITLMSQVSWSLSTYVTPEAIASGVMMDEIGKMADEIERRPRQSFAESNLRPVIIDLIILFIQSIRKIQRFDEGFLLYVYDAWFIETVLANRLTISLPHRIYKAPARSSSSISSSSSSSSTSSSPQ